jgi:selenocysteine-specific elongation factor
LRDASERYTIGGGIVLGLAEPGNQRVDTNSGWLLARAAHPNDCFVYVASELARRGIAEQASLNERSNFDYDEIGRAISHLAEQNSIMVSGRIVADRGHWEALRLRAAEMIDAFHKKHPDQRGISVSDLRSALNLRSDAAFSALINGLSDFTRIDGRITRRSHRATLSIDLQPAAHQILESVSKKPFDPPNRSEIAKDDLQQRALRFLLAQGELIQIGPELVLSRDAAAQMERIIREHLSSRGTATASELRQALGSSRRVVIPFLEYLDHTHVTHRLGDKRVLAK